MFGAFPQGFLDHKQLMIIKGIGATPTDSLSAENPPVVVNLMAGAITLETNGWSPNIPQTKNGGVWADSPITDGRTLLAAPEGNVTEQMTLIISDASYLGAMKALNSLNQMVIDCRDYWQAIYQIDPVYLAWWAGCGAGTQYSLISNIELKPEYMDSPNPSIRVSMTIEREVRWRLIPPGANPKLATFILNNQAIGLGGKVLADATLVTGSDHLITQTIQNKAEWTPAAFGLQSTFITQNFISISASQVPGDMPALVEMSITGDVGSLADVYVGRSTKKQTGIGHDGITRVNSYILNVGDAGGSVTKTVGTSADGVKSNGSSVNFTFGTRTTTGVDGGFVGFCFWGENTGLIKLDREYFRGTFAVFVRAFNNSGTPLTTDMTMRVLFEEYENATNQYLNSFATPSIAVPLAASGFYPLTYMGTVTLPLAQKAVVSPLGYGIQLQETNSNLRITFQNNVLVATANRIIKLVDLIFVPIDEGVAQIAFTPNSIFTNAVAVLDDTGYSTRGESRQVANVYMTNANSGGVSMEVRGQNLELKPHTDQRLYFIADTFESPSVISSRLTQTLAIRLNIVPCWSGIRDI